MRPAFLDSLSWEMAEVYGAVQDRILINLARYFPYIQDGDEPAGSFQYQVKMLAQMGQVNRETIAIIRDGLEGADDALKNSLAAAILDALKKEDPELEKAARAGLLPNAPATPPPVTANMSQAFQSYYRQSADKLNLVNTVMLESTQQAYAATVSDVASRISGIQRGLNIATGETVTGVSSYNQAIRHAVDRMVANGITGFVDHAGRRWNAETYAAMDIKTTMFNTARAAVWERQEQYGNDLYQVSFHIGARPLCYPYQGKVISRTDSARVVTDLDGNEIHVIPQSQTSYGQAAGLFGINCKHYPMSFIPGFSTLKGEHNRQDEEENTETYENLQHQRGLERKIREQKRDLAVLKAQGATDEEIQRARDRVKKTSDEIDEFCMENNLPRRKNREGTPINSTWPAKETYDASLFSTEERDRINAFFGGGGAQQSYTFKQNNLNEQDASTNEFVKTPQIDASIGQPVPTADEKSDIEKSAESYGIARLTVEKMPEKLSESDIINKVGGGDRTDGSCASVALAYCGNKGGLDVLDFRGGISREFFASPGTAKMLAELENVQGIVIDNGYMFTNAHKLLKKVEEGKEYFFTSGRHATIVRKTNNVLKYLELQTQDTNGWYELDDSVLAWRFGCTKREKKPYDVLIDIEKLQENLSFRGILEFLNTEKGSQLKGVGGYAK